MIFSVFSWAIIFSKWNVLRTARAADRRFLRAFRKAGGLDAVMVASEQFKPAPLVSVFEFGYEEVHRQVQARGSVTNKISLERSLQLGTSEELTKLERNMSWLATTASVSPFIGLFGTVLGIIRAFQELGMQGSASLRAVGSRHCRRPDRHRRGTGRGHSRSHLLQPLRPHDSRDRHAHGRLRARIPQHGRAELRRVAVAITMNGNGGYGFRVPAPASAAMLSEINVTPFVDVMLVLLIIFMLTAHVMEFGIQVDVPKTRACPGQRQRPARCQHHQGRHSLPQR